VFVKKSGNGELPVISDEARKSSLPNRAEGAREVVAFIAFHLFEK